MIFFIGKILVLLIVIILLGIAYIFIKNYFDKTHEKNGSKNESGSKFTLTDPDGNMVYITVKGNDVTVDGNKIEAQR